ncbi:hypothetical protein [Clostridium grantii]|uniref:Uncharacterized protein n=1 Tax=Clostridium grantii DSM 8605 TaxID=1121316 RepID=A0A1M5XWL9_9CLOT|nr:hypothetical protein [Clostridium grantii]SHI04089.1 hypothetical protein SAMN02745207_03988 [Clostridium grantii DSM 8605]
MKTIIKENERGYLFKNGKFVKILTPGKHSYLSFFGYHIEIEMCQGKVALAGIPINVLMRDGCFY